MRDFARRHDLPFPYLHDETQKIARAYGAVCTPDFFGYDRELKLKYRGRLDEGRAAPPPPDARRELVEAMRAIAADRRSAGGPGSLDRLLDQVEGGRLRLGRAMSRCAMLRRSWKEPTNARRSRQSRSRRRGGRLVRATLDVEGLHVEGDSFEDFCRNVAGAAAISSKTRAPATAKSRLKSSRTHPSGRASLREGLRQAGSSQAERGGMRLSPSGQG